MFILHFRLFWAYYFFMKNFIFFWLGWRMGGQYHHELIRYCPPIYVLCVSSHFWPFTIVKFVLEILDKNLGLADPAPSVGTKSQTFPKIRFEGSPNHQWPWPSIITNMKRSVWFSIWKIGPGSPCLTAELTFTVEKFFPHFRWKDILSLDGHWPGATWTTWRQPESFFM